ncbi:DUF4352 domain-containing protein [Aeromicrobium sp.]|uniref:DUF4352 domain-containing protein n=1 Tax=Aeromicrobium sp. TaxID=1871063 RepID=UPI003D6B474A
MSEKAPAGWYPDSDGTNRWWDGDQWTDHQHPAPGSAQTATAVAAPAQAQPPVRTRADAKAEKAYAKATRPWYKKKRWIGLLAVIALSIVIAATSGGSDSGGPEVVGNSSSGDTSSNSNKTGSKSNPVKVGETVKLEGTEYTVKSAKKTPTVGGEFFKEKANGVFVVVELTVENKKDETKTFLDEATKFIATNDKKYSTDSDGTIASAGEGDESFMLMDMQPDVPETGILVYDVPVGKAKGGLLEVSDLFGGGEAYIDLGL